MILSLLRRKRSPVPEALYAEIVAAARRPGFYTDLAVPDTVDGRFELLILHAFLFLRRTKREDALSALAQDVVDRLFLELDRALREGGVGDLSVPKKMTKLAGLFYARIKGYEPHLDAGDRAGLAEVLERAIFAEAGNAEAAARLADYLFRADAELAAAVPAETLLAGHVAFATLAP